MALLIVLMDQQRPLGGLSISGTQAGVKMHIQGGCYCGAVRYEAQGEPLMKLQCFCRECQYISGGDSNLVMAMAQAEFRYTQGQPSQFRRADLDAPVTREFCGNCGTHLLTRSPRMKDAVLIKIGTLDDPSLFQKPSVAIFAAERQTFHRVCEGVPIHERRVGS